MLLSPAGHLLSFTTTADGGNWQVFDLTGFSGSRAVLTTAPHPIAFGSTVHVYATDNNKHLHDFYKTVSDNWRDIDLTNTTTGAPHAIFGVPFAYGGNSIQTVSTSASGDLEIFIQTAFSDGAINFNVRPSAFDITQLSGDTEFPFGTSSPVVTGNSTVNIFVDDTNSNLVDFTKTPTGPWQVSTVASLGQRNLTPSALWNASLGLHVVTNNRSGPRVRAGGWQGFCSPADYFPCHPFGPEGQGHALKSTAQSLVAAHRIIFPRLGV